MLRHSHVVLAPRRVIVIFVVVLAPGRVIGTSRGAVCAIVVGTMTHLIFLAMVIVTRCVAVGHGSAVVAIVLGTAADFILIALVMAIVEVSAYVTVLTELTQFLVEVASRFWLAIGICSASPAVVAVVIVVALSVIVCIDVNKRVGIAIDRRVGVTIDRRLAGWLTLLMAGGLVLLMAGGSGGWTTFCSTASSWIGSS